MVPEKPVEERKAKFLVETKGKNGVVSTLRRIY